MRKGIYIFIIAAAFVTGYYTNEYFNAVKNKKPQDDTYKNDAQTAQPALVDYKTANVGIERNNDLVRAIEKASKSIVFIGVLQIKIYQNPFFEDPFFRQFFPPSVQEYKSMGSGVIVSEKGYIVTNYHVIENAAKIEVHCQDGKQYEAKLIGADPFTDLAIIKIEGINLPAVMLCPNDSLYTGEWAIAIGNPFGALIQDNKPTVTMGVISAVNREFTRESGVGSQYKNMIQTDAAINPGNSGGALINCLGELIGINTFIFTQGGGGSIGVGFAIPVSRVRKTLKEVIKYGKIRSFYTGISIQDIDINIAQSLGLKMPHGVIVNGVERRSPGAKAGLKVEDIIVRVEKYEILDRNSIQDVFNQFLPGDTVKLNIIRSGKEKELRMVLESRD